MKPGLNSIIETMKSRILRGLVHKMILFRPRPFCIALLTFSLTVGTQTVTANETATIQSIPSNVLVPPVNRAILLNALPKTKEARSGSTIREVSKELTRGLFEAIEEITLEIGAKGTPPKSRDEKKVQRLHFYLESLAWSNGRSDLVKAAKENAADILTSPNGKNNAIATLVSGLIEPLYAGDATAIEKLKNIVAKKRTELVGGEANLIIGDYLFSKRDYSGARPYLLAALGHPKLHRKVMTNLKLAWTLFDSGQTAEAVVILKTLSKNFKAPVTASKQRPKTQRSIFDQTIQNTTLSFMIRMYAEFGNLEAGHAALQAHGFKDQLPLFYLEFGKTNIVSESTSSEGVRALTKSTQDFKNHAELETASVLALDADVKFGRLIMASKNAEVFVTSIPKLKESENFQKSILRLADALYTDAMGKQDNAVIMAADSVYKILESTKLQAPDYNRIVWARAELAYARRDFDLASQLFLMLGKKASSDFFIMNQLNQKRLNGHRFTLENAVALSSNKNPNVFKQSCALLIGQYDNKSKSIAICDSQLPKIFMDDKDFNAAKAALVRRINKYPDSPDAQENMKILFGLVVKDGPEQRTLAESFLKIKSYNEKSEIKQSLSKLQYDAEIAEITRKTDPGEKLSLTTSLVTRLKDDPRASGDLMRASLDAEKNNLFDQASEGFNLLLRQFPSSSHVEESTFRLAELSERKFSLDQAANFYQMYDQKFSGAGVRSIIAKQKRCELSLVLDLKEALEACKALLLRDKVAARKGFERLIAKAFYEGRVDYLQVLVEQNYLKLFDLTSNERISALYKIYVSNKRIDPPAVKAATEMKTIYLRGPNQVSGEALKYVAELYYRDILFTKSIYDNLNLNAGSGKIETLIGVIEEKKRGLDNLQYQLTKIVQIGSPNWAAGSYYQIAQAHESFAAMLRNPPAIDGVKPVDVKQRLSPQAAALEDAALRLYERALSTLWKFRIYNEFAVKAIDGQARLSGSKVRFRDWIESPIVFNVNPATDGLEKALKDEK